MVQAQQNQDESQCVHLGLYLRCIECGELYPFDQKHTRSQCLKIIAWKSHLVSQGDRND